MRRGFLTGPGIGSLWMVVLSVTVAVAMSFATGDAFRPSIGLSLLWGAVAGGVVVALKHQRDLDVSFVGTGESEEDLLPFEPKAFVDALLET